MTSPELLSLIFFHLTLVFFVLDLANAQGLKVGFYQQTCPSAEAIIKNTTAQYISRAPSLAPALLRMHFHDCFVNGCDGSVLINSTKNNVAEKDSAPDLSLRGFQVIDGVKIAVEKECPGVVSCADILALVARDAVSMIKGPNWPVPTGRRDGRVSTAQNALNNLPSPFSNITQLQASFASKGLSVKDLAVLSGAHTIGISHCFPAVTIRLYNFTGKGDTDPTIDPNYAAVLKKICKPGDLTTLVEMDPGSRKTFDTHYYSIVSKRRGLFQSDGALLSDSETKAYVLSQISSGSTFLKDFGPAMVKMGKIGVLTGKSGEIRKRCAFIN
ncbi:unnamed protein product [Ilex paraguariensis]|uniref:Peroxidase n=1 Tax=Ilex paraguariensis TaxID=185542 RepID=A0ABC8QMF1_9AQUA